jgi:uncharacterized surface protein with fasciclin (FAS1) repeats
MEKMIKNKLEKPKYIIAIRLLPLVFLIVLANFIGCKQKIVDFQIFDKTNLPIMSYLRSYKEYSIMTRAIEQSNLSGMLSAYGNYTAFVPTDVAFAKYLASINSDTAKFFADNALVQRVTKYHLFNARYPSSTFMTGSLPTATLNGDYLTFDLSNGIRNAVVNKTVKIDSFDVKMNNGIVHIIDNVLDPPVLKLYEWMKGQTQYSIILEAFELTGNTQELQKLVYQKLLTGDSVKILRTIFLETNDVLAKSNIRSFDDLARAFSETYSTTKDYTNPNDGINRFVRYHMLNQRMFTSDIKLGDFVETSLTETFIIFSLKNEQFQINRRREFLSGPTDSVLRKIDMEIPSSNIITYNGIVHSVDTVLSIYRMPRPIVHVYFSGPSKALAPPSQNDWYDTITYPHPWVRLNFPISGTLWITSLYAGYPPNDCFRPRNAANDWWIKIYSPPILAGNYDVRVYVGKQSSDPNNMKSHYIYLDGVKIGDAWSYTDYDPNVAPPPIPNNFRYCKLTNITFTKRAVHEITIMPCAWPPFVSGATGPNIYLDGVEFRPTGK